MIIKKTNPIFLVFFFLLMGLPQSHAATGDASISATVYGSPLVITTQSAFAGAITSLTWNGKQFINASDHGRELQAAVFLGGTVPNVPGPGDGGVCLNPTEAGAGRDGALPSSSSQLTSYSASGNSLSSKTTMAYWMDPGTSGSIFNVNCIARSYKPYANQILSDDTVSKTVTIGFAGIPNVIQYNVTIHIADSWPLQTTFSPVGGIMPTGAGNFTQFYYYNPKTNVLNAFTPSTSTTAQNLPVIITTADKNYAMGGYSTAPNMLYNGWNMGPVVNWAEISRPSTPDAAGNLTPAGDYTYQSFVVVGTLQEVTASMSAVYHFLNDPVIGVVDGLTASNGVYNVTGWACVRSSLAPVSVNLTFGSSSVAHTTTNLASGTDIASLCQTTGANYRYSIPIPLSVIMQYQTQPLSVIASLPASGNTVAQNYPLAGSGINTPETLLLPESSVYKLYQPVTGEHYYTLVPSVSGYTSEGTAFKVFPSADVFSNLAPLYSCMYNPYNRGVMHFVSRNCAGYTYNGTYGYVNTSNVTGTTALYRYFLAATGDHLTTTNPADVAGTGYSLEGVLGYVPN